MKTKRIFQFGACVLGAFALILFAYISSLDSKPEGFNGTKFMSALAAYAQDTRARGEQLPETVTLDELIRRGFLQSDDVSAFAGMKAVISLGASETEPQSILMEVTNPDGTTMFVQGDGSVQSGTTARRLQLLKSAQPKTPPDPQLPAP